MKILFARVKSLYIKILVSISSLRNKLWMLYWAISWSCQLRNQIQNKQGTKSCLITLLLYLLKEFFNYWITQISVYLLILTVTIFLVFIVKVNMNKSLVKSSIYCSMQVLPLKIYLSTSFTIKSWGVRINLAQHSDQDTPPHHPLPCLWVRMCPNTKTPSKEIPEAEDPHAVHLNTNAGSSLMESWICWFFPM